MKKITLTLAALIGINFFASAQSAGDYRSVANGNWNDATKWQKYNGNSWIGSTVYPGQLSGAGTVAIMQETEIKVTTSVPYPVAGLSISIDNPTILTRGVLTFNAATAVTLSVSGDVVIGGVLRIDDQPGAKTHQLVIGRSLHFLDVSTSFQTINQDDKLGVTFNTTDPNSSISGSPGSQYISFHDITFNGTGILVNSSISIAGSATFINGIVRPGEKTATNGSDILSVFDIGFLDGTTISGGSNASYIEGAASKWGVEPFTFPMGHDEVYAPLTISGIAQPEKFYAGYWRNGTWAQVHIEDPELFSISDCEGWYLIRDISNPVNSSIDITVGWTSATRCGSSSYIDNVSDVVLTTGFSHGGTGTGTTANGSVTWSGYNHLDHWGSLTLGNVGTDCRTPSNLISTNITSNSATVSWSAVPGAVGYDVEYTTFSSNSWIIAATASTSTSTNLSGLSPLVRYNCRVRANCGSASSSYRQVQFTTIQAPPPLVCNDVYETNNTSSQAKSISLGYAISAGISSATDVDWFKVTMPNNSNTTLRVTLSNLPADYDLYVYNKNLILVGSSAATGISNEVSIYNSNAKKATYYIKVIGKNGSYSTSQCYDLLAQAVGSSGSVYHGPASGNEIADISHNHFLYPNPASEYVYLRFNSDVSGPADVQILNSTGQRAKLYSVNIIKGYNQLQIPVSDVSPGMYLLRINKGELNLVRKFVIAR